MPYGFVESFCGPGGLGLGLEQAGFTPLLAFDLNARAVETHRRNLPGPCMVADAARLTGRELLDRIGGEVGEVATDWPRRASASSWSGSAATTKSRSRSRRRLSVGGGLWARCWTDCPSPRRTTGSTRTGGFDSFTRGRYGHPHHDRPLTPREAARLQGSNRDGRSWASRPPSSPWTNQTRRRDPCRGSGQVSPAANAR
ncbi:MAG: DNA cytosine methyltransferase [Gemmatimonadota bacterium]|nr:DNA cytosine methyltransferase [Gemmatimonadota bacterium]